MRAVAAIILLLLVGVFFWRRSEVKRGEDLFALAKGMEDAGNYEAACFHYAAAANAGHRPQLCRQKVKDLWAGHGPFGFEEQLKETKAEYCRNRSCGEGYHRVTLQSIHGILGIEGDKGASRNAGRG